MTTEQDDKKRKERNDKKRRERNDKKRKDQDDKKRKKRNDKKRKEWNEKRRKEREDKKRKEHPWPTSGNMRHREAEDLIGQALNIGRVVAFVGSGVSMAYGRVGWGGLLGGVVQRVIDLSAKRAATDTDFRGKRAELEKLVAASITPERYPVVFQIAEDLATEHDRHLPSDAADPIDIRALLCAMIEEPGADSRRLFEEAGLARLDPAGWVGFQQAYLPTRAQQRAQPPAGSLYLFRHLFTRGTLARFAAPPGADPPARITALFRALAAAPCVPCGAAGNPAAPLTPLARFALPALLLLRDPAAPSALARLAQDFPILLSMLEAPTADHAPAGPPATVCPADLQDNQRVGLIPPSRDPLLILYDRLGITRFLTTNYDEEIESLFRDVGFMRPPAPASGAEYHDALGRMAREIVFSHDDTPALIDFAVQDPPARLEVVHLHGRAREGRVIVTERDYQGLYIVDHPTRPQVDQAIRLTFGANPILFVGLGMAEDDILRPLRQFASQSAHRDRRLAIALLPQLADADATRLQADELRLRYGVVVMHYGAARGHAAGSGHWLGHCVGLIQLLQDAFADGGHNPAAMSRIDQRLATLRSSAPGFFAKGAVQPPRLGLSGDPIDLGFEVGLLNACLACRREVPASPAAIRCIRYVLPHLRSAITSAFLCVRLLELGTSASGWRDRWQRIPEPRVPDIADPAFVTALGRRHADPQSAGAAAFAADAVLTRRQALRLDLHPANGTSWQFSRLNDRFRGAGWTRTTRELLAAMRHAPHPGPQQQRRIVLLLAQRGVGKGQLFDSLCNPELLGRVLAASLPAGTATGRYQGAALFSFSFSNEISSVFDRLSAFLAASSHRLGIADRTSTLHRGLGNDRIGLLRQRARQLCDWAAGRADCQRLCIVINGISQLFDRDGAAKNAQFQQLFEILVGDASKSLPVDLILISSEDSVPGQFRTAAPQAALPPAAIAPLAASSCRFVPIRAEGISARHERLVEEMLQRLDIHRADYSPNAVHVLRAPYAIELLYVRFPYVALSHPVAKPSAAAALPARATTLMNAAIAAGEPTDHPESITSVHVRNAATAVGLDAEACKKLDDFAAKLFRDLGCGQYVLSLVLAAAEERIVLDPGSDIGAITRGAIAAAAAHRGLERDLAVLDFVFGEYRRHHASRWPTRGLPRPIIARLGTATLHLLEILLWHLAIIGQPVERHVLLGFREVREAAAGLLRSGEFSWCKREATDDDARLAAIVRAALVILRQRCLVLCISSLGDPQAKRFVVHRVVQARIFRSLRAAFLAYPDVDRFSLSLFADQPNELPCLSASAHQRISEAIGSLMDAASSNGNQAAFVRAGFGIVRSIYHVGILAHFDAHGSIGADAPPDEGFLELYRRQIGWMLRHGGSGKASDGPPPFYAEEILWLINENAVLSLMQGRVGGAVAAFRLADKYARDRLEPQESGPIRRLVALNHAVAQIEHGERAAAMATCRAIINDAAVAPANRLIAHGYLGLAEHLGGRLSVAREYYAEAVAGLTRLRRSRPASIFLRHQSDAQRMLAGRDRRLNDTLHNDCQGMVLAAIQTAQEGGHRDIAQVAQLAALRLRIPGATASQAADIFRELDAIERYARVIGFPRLRCEAIALRGRLVLEQGDRSYAGRLALESLQIATAQDMRLRKVHALNLFGEVLLLQDRPEESWSILQQSSVLANEYGFHHALEWIGNRLAVTRRDSPARD